MINVANDDTFNLHALLQTLEILNHDGVAELWNTLETDPIAALFSKSQAIG